MASLCNKGRDHHSDMSCSGARVGADTDGADTEPAVVDLEDVVAGIPDQFAYERPARTSKQRRRGGHSRGDEMRRRRGRDADVPRRCRGDESRPRRDVWSTGTRTSRSTWNERCARRRAQTTAQKELHTRPRRRHGGAAARHEIDRFRVRPAAALARRHYENQSVDDIYRRWEELVKPEDLPKLQAMVLGLLEMGVPTSERALSSTLAPLRERRRGECRRDAFSLGVAWSGRGPAQILATFEAGPARPTRRGGVQSGGVGTLATSSRRP